MKALSLEQSRRSRLIDVDLPQPGPDQVLVRVLACGVCGSDLNAWRGVPGIDYPMAAGLPGHEVYGEVVDGRGVLRAGQRVTGLFSAGYAEYALASVDELAPLPESWNGCTVLGEPLACALCVVERAQLDGDCSVAVVGFGYLAALAMRLAAAGRWVALSRREEMRRLALDMGAAAAYDYASVPADAWDSFDVVIEAAGVQQTLDVATWLTAQGGRLVIAGYHADGPRTVNMQSWNWKGIDVINAHERDPRVYMRRMRDALQMLDSRGIAPDELISHRWPLASAAEAFAAADQHPAGYIKGVIEP